MGRVVLAHPLSVAWSAVLTPDGQDRQVADGIAFPNRCSGARASELLAMLAKSA